jgi:hypothetical protein
VEPRVVVVIGSDLGSQGSASWSRPRPHFAADDAVLQICSSRPCTDDGDARRQDHQARDTRSSTQPFPQVEMLMGGFPDEREPPIMPSGRQDLNLRPLDPQYGQRVALTCGNKEPAAWRGAVQRISASFKPAWRNAVLQICSTCSSQSHRRVPPRRARGAAQASTTKYGVREAMGS